MTRKYKRKKTNSNKTRSILLTTLLVSVAFLMGLWFGKNNVSFQGLETYVNEMSSQIRSVFSNLNEDKKREKLADYHFFDMDQGSSVLLEAFDGTTILIDTGRYDDSDPRIINYLNAEIGIGGEIDLLIFTHNDADRIGNGDLVLDYFQVNEVWMNGMDHTSETYSEVLDALSESDAIYAEPKNGYTTEIGAFSIEVLHPLENEKQSSQNDESIITRITLGDTVLMHMGDANIAVEERILNEASTASLQSDIIVLGNHGSSTSTSKEWLQAIKPSVAIYQAGVGNHYGTPHREIVQLFDDHPAELLGTDNYGTIHIVVNENNQIDISTEDEG
ncbi:ComEC/Rec2 family competence protein [Alkalibacterium sp. f15]|uniref:ComEC/Rec2 family competence protein n=1 Tax=Alkalibacterium sp. f15 TaxID=3414029 RepID=UPI003BF91710